MLNFKRERLFAFRLGFMRVTKDPNRSEIR